MSGCKDSYFCVIKKIIGNTWDEFVVQKSLSPSSPAWLSSRPQSPVLPASLLPPQPSQSTINKIYCSLQCFCCDKLVLLHKVNEILRYESRNGWFWLLVRVTSYEHVNVQFLKFSSPWWLGCPIPPLLKPSGPCGFLFLWRTNILVSIKKKVLDCLLVE